MLRIIFKVSSSNPALCFELNLLLFTVSERKVAPEVGDKCFLPDLDTNLQIFTK